MENKILSPKTLPGVVNKLKRGRKKIVFTNGCFDILHLGHVTYLKKAKAKGDVLIIGVNSDFSVRKIKGPFRPINNQKTRLAVLSSLDFVDYVILFNEDTPYNLIAKIKPHVLVKGADWHIKKIVGADIVLSSGGKVARIPYVKGFSTTSLIKKISRKAGKRPQAHC